MGLGAQACTHHRRRPPGLLGALRLALPGVQDPRQRPAQGTRSQLLLGVSVPSAAACSPGKTRAVSRLQGKEGRSQPWSRPLTSSLDLPPLCSLRFLSEGKRVPCDQHAGCLLMAAGGPHPPTASSRPPSVPSWVLPEDPQKGHRTSARVWRSSRCPSQGLCPSLSAPGLCAQVQVGWSPPAGTGQAQRSAPSVRLAPRGLGMLAGQGRPGSEDPHAGQRGFPLPIALS